MQPRARRVTITAAVVGAAVLAVLVFLNWSMVRDHVKAWKFQLTRETRTIKPDGASESWPYVDSGHMLQGFANRSSLPIILSAQFEDSFARRLSDFTLEDLVELSRHTPGDATDRFSWSKLTMDPRAGIGIWLSRPELTIRFLASRGYRVLEQRFPRRAYVVIPRRAHRGPHRAVRGPGGVRSR